MEAGDVMIIAEKMRNVLPVYAHNEAAPKDSIPRQPSGHDDHQFLGAYFSPLYVETLDPEMSLMREIEERQR